MILINTCNLPFRSWQSLWYWWTLVIYHLDSGRVYDTDKTLVIYHLDPDRAYDTDETLVIYHLDPGRVYDTDEQL